MFIFSSELVETYALLQKALFVNIVFKQMESIFGEELAPNVLTIHIQPTEGLLSRHEWQRGRRALQLGPLSLDYRTDATASGASRSLRKINLCASLTMTPTNFSHWDEVRSTKDLIDQIEELWRSNEVPLPSEYPVGSMGPDASLNSLENLELTGSSLQKNQI